MEKCKFKVGERYKCVADSVEKGAVIEITGINGCFVFYKDVIGRTYGSGKKFHKLSPFAVTLEKITNDTIVIYRKDRKVVALDKTNGKREEARCNSADEFDFHIGAKLAFQRLLGEAVEDKKSDSGVREVRRRAKAGEYIKTVFPFLAMGKYSKDDVLKATIDADSTGCFALTKNKEEIYIGNLEYVVLENYKPEEKKEDDTEIHVGDMVEVVDCGETYSFYDNWTGLKGYNNNFVKGSPTENGMIASVLKIAKHDNPLDTRKDIFLIQNPNTTQVFIIGIDGLKKVER